MSMNKRADILAFSGFVCGLTLLAFLAGALATIAELPATGFVRDGYRAARAAYEQRFRYSDPYATDLWSRARDDRGGVTAYDPAAARTGLTLYTSGDAAHALLIDMDGDVVHEWQRAYSTIWDERAAVRHPVSDQQVYFRKARLLPNGDLLALYEGVGDTPYGYGMARLDAHSEVIWKNLDNFHHDFDVMPDGSVVTLAQAFRNTQLPGADQFTPPYLEDSLVLLDPDGNTRSKLSLLDAFNESAYRSLLWRIPYYSMEDPLHANGVDYLDAAAARALAHYLPMAREGQILVSLRELAGGTVALVDPERGRVVWASRGPWLAQHDPDVTPRGTLLVFDNRGNVAGRAQSRIVEVDPRSLGVLWTYVDDDETPFNSPIRGSQQELDNGNLLITESSGGRLLEITRDGRIVWEYVNPVRGGTSENLIPVVSGGTRIRPESLDAAFLGAAPRAHLAAR